MCIYNKKARVCIYIYIYIYICVCGSCLNKCISVALGPPKQKFLAPPLAVCDLSKVGDTDQWAAMRPHPTNPQIEAG